MNTVEDLYSDKVSSYHRFIGLGRYAQGIEAFFRQNTVLGSGMKILDAGCGSGVVTKAAIGASAEAGFEGLHFQGFDLSQAMLDRFSAWIESNGVTNIDLMQADALTLDRLPPDWRGYDLIATSAMLEYLPRAELPKTLRALRERLAPEGRLVLFISRENPLMELLIRRWWKAMLYSRRELQDVLQQAGFATIEFANFPGSYRYLDLWGLIALARK